MRLMTKLPKVPGGRNTTWPSFRCGAIARAMSSCATAGDGMTISCTPCRASPISAVARGIVTAKGCTVSDWRVLASLEGAEPMSIGALARLTVLKQPTLTRVVDRLEARGHVKRIAHESDRRMTLIAITPAGEKLVTGLIP